MASGRAKAWGTGRRGGEQGGRRRVAERVRKGGASHSPDRSTSVRGEGGATARAIRKRVGNGGHEDEHGGRGGEMVFSPEKAMENGCVKHGRICMI